MADKGKQEGMTRKEVAARLDVSVSTIRSWQRQFKDWLEVEDQAYSGGRKQATTYSDKDILVFTVVKRLTGPPDHLPFKKVKKRLDKELTTATFELPDKEEQPPVDEGEQSKAVVPIERYSAVVAKLQGAEGKLEAVTEERDWLRERVTGLEDKVDKERQRSDEERADLQRQLDEERQKSWLDKLFRR